MNCLGFRQIIRESLGELLEVAPGLFEDDGILVGVHADAVGAERVGRPARPEVLEEIARVTHGKMLAPGKMDQLLQSLANLPDPPSSIRRVQLWSHPVLAGMVVLLLGVFWVGRKIVGLI